MSDITIFVLSMLNLTILIMLCSWIASVEREAVRLKESVNKLKKDLHEAECENARLSVRIIALEKDGGDGSTD